MKNREVLDKLLEFGRVYIVGSYAIYKALHIENQPNKDIDVIIKTDAEISQIKTSLLDLGGTFVGENNFGGVKINFRGQIFDIWRIKDTRIFEPDFERKYHRITDVISSFGFNLYQVCVCVEDGMILSTEEFQKYSRTQELELINKNILNIEWMVEKATKINSHAIRSIRK